MANKKWDIGVLDLSRFKSKDIPTGLIHVIKLHSFSNRAPISTPDTCYLFFSQRKRGARQFKRGTRKNTFGEKVLDKE